MSETGEDELRGFANDFLQDVILTAQLEDDEALLPETFTRLVLDQLEEAGELQEGVCCYHRDRGIEVSGYGVDDEEEVLDLFTTIYRGTSEPTTVGKTEIDGAFRRLRGFWTRASDSYHADLEEASEVFDMALRVHDVRDRSRQGTNVSSHGRSVAHRVQDERRDQRNRAVVPRLGHPSPPPTRNVRPAARTDRDRLRHSLRASDPVAWQPSTTMLTILPTSRSFPARY